MKIENYYQKNGFIFGVSSRYNFGWHHQVFRFRNLETARLWLETEEHDFRERELCSLSRARKIAGNHAKYHDIEGYNHIHGFCIDHETRYL